jgi:hypothetical protein
VVGWLAAADSVQQLAALGYQPQELQQQLAAAAEALPALMTYRNPDLSAQRRYPLVLAAPEVLKNIQEQLQAAGRVLACFAIPLACNNPACRNLGGSSEAQLVGVVLQSMAGVGASAQASCLMQQADSSTCAVVVCRHRG